MNKENLKEKILNYFNAYIIKENNNIYIISKKNNKIYISKPEDEYSELDLFIYLYNDNKKYDKLKSTFNHNTQKERYDILYNYYNDFNFIKFRIGMNRLLKDSYYIGHPLTVIN